MALKYLLSNITIYLITSACITPSKDEAVKKEVAAPNTVIECIDLHGLESLYSPENLRTRLAPATKGQPPKEVVKRSDMQSDWMKRFAMSSTMTLIPLPQVKRFVGILRARLTQFSHYNSLICTPHVYLLQKLHLLLIHTMHIISSVPPVLVPSCIRAI